LEWRTSCAALWITSMCEKPTTPMGEGASLALGSSGTLKRINEEFVVLGVDNEPTRELWIPRSVILLLDVKRTK